MNRSIGILKTLVVVMGVLIVVGTAILLVTMVGLVAHAASTAALVPGL